MSRGLGRGLSALMDDDMPLPAGKPVSEVVAMTSDSHTLPINQLQPGAYQPRHHFDEEALQELAESIRRNGVLQPVLVRPLPSGRYEIIAGERRWRASQKAGLTDIPAIIRPLQDTEALEIALVENVQRKDLNPLEEAEGYQRLIDEFSYTQDALAGIIGKSRSHITNYLRLLKLPSEVKALLMEERITMGHARALLNSSQPVEMAKQIVERGLSVRQVERLVQLPADRQAMPVAQREVKRKPVREPKSAEKNPDIAILEQTISQNLGLEVEIATQDENSGELTIRYQTLNQLDELLRRLGGAA